MATFLALLVALLPLQASLASLAVSSHSDQVVTSNHEHAKRGVVAFDAVQFADDCTLHSANTCDLSFVCSFSGFCCGPAAISVSNLPEITADSIPFVEIPRPPRRTPTALFRPPRA